MTSAREWRLDLYRDLNGEVSAALYECQGDGQWMACCTERFGPFETAYDVCQWLTRHWAPRAHLPLS